MLEIPDIPPKEALFTFMDVLNRWANLELQRRDVQHITQAMVIVESLIEFQNKDATKTKGKDKRSF